MKSAREVEDVVRRHRWPSPPVHLRSRILSEARFAEPSQAIEIPETGMLPAPVPRWPRHATVVLMISIVLTFGACTGADVWFDRQVEAEVERIERTFGSLDLGTMTVPPVPAGDNRADVARAAVALTVQPTNAEWKVLATMRNAHAVPEDLRGFVQANDAAVRHADGIRARAQSNWGVDYEHDGKRPDYLAVRVLSDAIWLSALADLEAGRVDEAATKHASGLALAASLRQEPEIVAQLIRIAIVNRQISGLHELVTTAEPSRSALDDVSRWLAENRVVDPMAVGPLGELKQGHAIFARMERGDVDRRIVQDLYPRSLAAIPESWMRPIARIGRPLVRLAHARYLQQMEEMLAVQAAPRPRAAWSKVEIPRWWDPSYRLVSYLRAGIHRSIESGDDFYSELGVAEVAVALRRYRLDYGSYPSDLAALVPKYMPSIPLDPYSGRPPVYSRDAGGFTLSVGSMRSKTAARSVLEWKVSR